MVNNIELKKMLLEGGEQPVRRRSLSLNAVTRDVRRGETRDRDNLRRHDRLIPPDIRAIIKRFMRCCVSSNGIFVDNPSATRVNQHATYRQKRELARTDQLASRIFCIIIEWHMDTDHVAPHHFV